MVLVTEEPRTEDELLSFGQNRQYVQFENRIGNDTSPMTLIPFHKRNKGGEDILKEVRCE